MVTVPASWVGMLRIEDGVNLRDLAGEPTVPAVYRILHESKRQQLLEKVDTVLAMPDALADLKGWLLSLREEIASSDWSKIGAILGLLWYKLDSIIAKKEQAIEELRAIRRNTEKLK